MTIAIDPHSQEIISRIFLREGGSTFTNDPADSGGATKFGITQVTLAQWRQGLVSPEDVKELTEAEAREITFELYLRRPGFTQVEDLELRDALVDFTYLFGLDDSIPALQKLVGVSPDGVLGPKTALAVNGKEARGLINALAGERIRLHVRRVVGDLKAQGHFSGQVLFLAGWCNRALGFVK